MARQQVYYAINESPRHNYFARRSIASLRQRNHTVPVAVVVFGSPNAELVDLCRQLDVSVLARPPVDPKQCMFVKWKALSELDAEQVLFLDADTIVECDIAKIFHNYSTRKFYSRRGPYSFTQKPSTRRRVGSAIQVRREGYRSLAQQLGANLVFPFNTAVMLFNGGTHRVLAEAWPKIDDLRQKFETKVLPYPTDNWWVVEEIASALVLGTLPEITIGGLGRHTITWYPEELETPPVDLERIMHIGSDFYPLYVLATEGPTGLASMPIDRNSMAIALQRLAQYRSKITPPK